MTDLTADRISDALTLSQGNVSEAARTLNVSRVTLYKWMKRYGITVTKRPETAAGIAGYVLAAHDEGDVRVIDEFRLTEVSADLEHKAERGN